MISFTYPDVGGISKFKVVGFTSSFPKAKGALEMISFTYPDVEGISMFKVEGISSLFSESPTGHFK